MDGFFKFSVAIVVGLVAFGCTPKPTPAPEQPADDKAVVETTPAPVAQAGPAPGETCAAYVQRTSAGVRCIVIDQARCSCELINAVAGEPPPTDTGPTTGGVGQAIVNFTAGPPDATVRCLSDVCPTHEPVLLANGFPPINLQRSPEVVRFEIAAPNFLSQVVTANLGVGPNTVDFTLQPRTGGTPPDPNQATLRFQGGPQGTTVQCLSGLCPDKQSRPLTDPFPTIDLSKGKAEILLNFSAPGHRSSALRFKLDPGPNLISVDLEPITRDAEVKPTRRRPREDAAGGAE
ncbi:MAG: hypothetical protein KC636_36105 [Myxococcales bacterium]|nr:hypothetical protein [Myxococcales bacterium]